MTQHSRKACILQGKNVETGHFSVWGKVSVCVCVWGGGGRGVVSDGTAGTGGSGARRSKSQLRALAEGGRAGT